ncbi:FMN-binding domain-containing protein [Dethiosulfatibacter aminovorans DSM 17477]|uniref:FMN-binding domain-containing protein n=1 Tax=Dethiosulfatibacter aminovorans DSM 17477 TaxID=1121476 RepID=A0A1M6HI73_9FIRM|nr:FMN-binding protein [Dethiosulfatibacter aminovorans]SHJ21900.1 FMN-binding domain-containing protein [Dethiosulfatibacter aminovorans DSM 17477]
MALLIAASLVLLSFNPVQRNEYLASIYPEAKIKKSAYDESLNSNDCFVGYVYEVRNGSSLLECYFIKSMGYKDFVHYMVEIDCGSERIKKVRLIEEHETDDYGGYIREGWFLERFENLSLNHPTEIVKMHKENDYDIVAITGATITSLSAVKAVNLAMENYKN